ncbi:MFS transporter [Candidatus Pacearchaeota archaeon]|nr:MFS transporter [Candidatus Pacearchaeota archaeon]
MKFSKKVKTLLYGMEFTHGIRRALMAALGLIYFLSFGFNVVSITTLFAISVIVMTLFEFPTGAIADYDSRKKSIMISFFLMSLAFFGLFIFKSFWLLAGSWMLGDIAWAFFSGSGSAWSIDALNISKKKSKLVSLISKGYIFEKGGHILGGLIGLVLISINFRFVWLFVAICQLFMFFIVWRYMEERNFKPEKVKHNYLIKSMIKARESFSYIIHKKNKQLRALMLGDFLGILAGSAFFIAMPLLFIQILNLSPGSFSGIIALIAALSIISPVIAEKFAHKKGIKYSLVLFVFLSSIFMISFALSNSIIFAIIFLTLLRISIVVLDVVGDSAYHCEFDSKIRASLGSMNNVIWAIGFSIAVFLAGLSINFIGVVNTLLISGALSLLEGFVYLIGLRRD